MATATTTPTPDAAVRAFVQDAGQMTVGELREKIEQLLSGHPDVARLAVKPRGKKGAGAIDVYGTGGAIVAHVNVKANGEVDALPADQPATAPKPNGGGRRGTAKERAALELQALNEKHRKSGHTSAMVKQARDLATKAGVDTPAWAMAAGNGPRTANRKPKDEKAATIAKAAQDLSGIKTPIGATQARKVIDVVGRKKIADLLPDGVTYTSLEAYARRGKTARGVKAETIAAVKAIAGKTGDRLVWGQKCAALLVAIHEAR